MPDGNCSRHNHSGAEVQGYSLAVRWYRAWRVHAIHASKLTCHERHPTFLLLRLIIRPAPICQAVTATFCTSATASGSCLMGCGHAWGSCIAWIAEYGGLAHSPWACPRMSPVSFFRQLGNDHLCWRPSLGQVNFNVLCCTTLQCDLWDSDKIGLLH